MRENPEISLKVLQLLADEPSFPSRLDDRAVARELQISYAEALLHIKCCMDADLIEANIVEAGTLAYPSNFMIGSIQGLTVTGQDFVRGAEANDGGWWRKAREELDTLRIEATTSAIGQAMQVLTSQAIQGLGG